MRFSKYLLLATTTACVLPTQAFAQTEVEQTTTVDSEEEDSGDAIVVVGSQIKGSKINEALPVTVLGAEDIANTAAASGDELFRSIPQMGDVSFNSSYLPNSSNSARGDVGSVNLRQLGVGNTLTLLNGRRVVHHPTSRADDNLVPCSPIIPMPFRFPASSGWKYCAMVRQLFTDRTR